MLVRRQLCVFITWTWTWTFLVLNGFIQNSCYGCNIDTRDPYGTYSEDPGSYFGYTVLQHFNSIDGNTVLIGAPRGQSSNFPSVTKPGTLYSCWSAEPFTCDEVDLRDPSGVTSGTLLSEGIIDYRDNGWMGVSLTRQTKTGASNQVTICGHRVANDIALQNAVNLTANEEIDRYPQGLCYQLSASLIGRAATDRFNPCAQEQAWKDNVIPNDTLRWQGWCQFGISAKYSLEEPNVDQRLVFGAVGSYDWTGTTYTHVDASTNVGVGDLNAWNSDHNDFYQYAGYSVAVGYFMSTTSQQGATGAPRASDLVGKVYIYDLNDFTIYQELYGEKMNTYFGGTIEALDLNNDGLTDLLVGAPLYFTDQDEGRVYVYINRGGSNPLQLQETLSGSNAVGARFGQTITYLGDLNLDTFSDVAVGAPYEGGGVVYVYQGNAAGLDPAPTQRIVGANTEPTIHAFGSSIAGGLDLDSNNYPDLVVGAYANDTVYLFRTRPLLKLQTTLTVTPDPMDPEMTNCLDLEGQRASCLNVTVCYFYEGASLPADIEVIYQVDVDEVKTASGFKSRFLFEDGAELVTRINVTKTIVKDATTCFKYNAILQSTATDFLSSMPVRLTYILMDYPVEPAPRGDESRRFLSGLAPVMDSYQCGPETTVEEVEFVRDCGPDAVCETDIRLTADIEIEGNSQATPTVIVVGGPSRLYVNARIDNVGEEAHQAFFTITHPGDVRYEGLEINQFSCISLDGSPSTGCAAEEVLVRCNPVRVDIDTSRVSCNLGNPMQALTARTLRLRFDTSGLVWAPNRDLSIVMEATTSSLQQNATLADNERSLQYQLIVEADLGISTSVTPESVFYSTNSTRYVDEASAQQALDEAVQMALTPDPASSSAFNATYIGSPFTATYGFTNYGSGRMPVPSVFRINIPWRLVDGAWLVFIKDIQVTDNTRSVSCNTIDLLALQSKRLLEFYVHKTGALFDSPLENVSPIFSSAMDADEMWCSNAKCVQLTCNIDSLQSGHNIDVKIVGLQWEHTFITRKLGYVEIITEASVSVPGLSGNFQGNNTNPDEVQLAIVMFTDVAGVGSVPIWVIIVSVLGGILLLILIILILWKCGFFKRKTREDWEKEADDAGPAPVKATPATNGEPDGSDEPFMDKPKE